MIRSPHDVPRCFSSAEEWLDWCAVRAGACSPCGDCTPEYRGQMLEQGRCDRPEVVFAMDVETGEVEGLPAEDPRFSLVLRGLPLGRSVQIISHPIEQTEKWRQMLEAIEARAHKETQRAIQIWLRRFERAGE